ncbi:MAG: STING domain-containing protein [Flavobacteriales bacterium]
MTDLKPKIFIGSSGDGLPTAEQVRTNLSSIGDCFVWNDSGVWEPNKSTFDNLLRMAGYFDFGVFVATMDDVTLTKDALVMEPRDNVILEMALFLGALGRDKAFLLVENGIKLPSDFDGIYMARFDRGDAAGIASACQEYADHISEHYHQGHFSLYPTTALAIGYFKNFLEELVESAEKADPLVIGGVAYTDFKVKVVMPRNLEGRIREKADLFYKQHSFVQDSLKTKFRKHNTWFQLDPTKAPVAVLYDMPSTLTGIDDAIEILMKKGYVGRPKMQKVIEERELNNFRRVLQMQINSSAYAEARVEIIDEF